MTYNNLLLNAQCKLNLRHTTDAKIWIGLNRNSSKSTTNLGGNDIDAHRFCVKRLCKLESIKWNKTGVRISLTFIVIQQLREAWVQVSAVRFSCIITMWARFNEKNSGDVTSLSRFLELANNGRRFRCCYIHQFSVCHSSIPLLSSHPGTRNVIQTMRR